MEHGALADVDAHCGHPLTHRRAGSSGGGSFTGLPPKVYWLVSHFLFQHTLTINITLPISYVRQALAEVHRWIRVCILSGTQFRWERPAQHCIYVVAAFWRIDRALPVGRVCKGLLHGILSSTHGYTQWKLGGQGSLQDLGVITCEEDEYHTLWQLFPQHIPYLLRLPRVRWVHPLRPPVFVFDRLPEAVQVQILRLAVFRRTTVLARLTPSTTNAEYRRFLDGVEGYRARGFQFILYMPAPLTEVLKFEQVAMTILRPLGSTCSGVHYKLMAPIVSSMQLDLCRRGSLPSSTEVVYNGSREAHVLVEPHLVANIPAYRIVWPLQKDRPPL